MQNFFEILVRFLRLIFGKWNWEKPSWVVKLLAFVGAGLGKARRIHNSNPRRSYLSALGLVLVLSGVGGGYYWYITLPQPVKMGWSISSVGATVLKKEPTPFPLVIEFGGSAAKLSDIGKEVKEGVYFSPEIKGTWTWGAGDQLVFKVAEDWPVGTTHEIILDKKLFPKHVILENYRKEFIAPTLDLSVLSTEFYQSPKKPEDKKVVAEVSFSHPVDKASFEKRVSLVFVIRNGKDRKTTKKDLDFKVTYDEFLGKAFLQTEKLPIPNYESSVELEIKKGVVSSRGGVAADYTASGTAEVPGMLTHFRFENADLTLVRNKKYEPEQVLVMASSADIKQADLTEFMEVYTLPKDRPAQPGKVKAQRNYYWNVGAVTDGILKLSKKLDLTEIPTENENSKIISYKYKEEPGQYLYIRVKKGIKAFGGYKLTEAKEFVVQVPQYPKEIKVMGDGSLLSLSGDKKLSILARDLYHVKYTARRILPGQLAHLVSQTSGSFKEPNFNNWQFGLDNIAETFSEIKTLPWVERGKTQYSYFDFSKALREATGVPKGLYYFTAQGWDKANQYAVGPKDSRLILVTDIGIIIKQSTDKSYQVFLQSIANGKPISQAEVSVIGKNGLSVLKQISDSRGQVQFDDLSSFENEKAPTVFVVKKGGDLSFLPVRSKVYSLNYSRFDVGGVRSYGRRAHLNAYMFSDRGIYRPGEAVNIGYIVKDHDWARDLSGINVELKVVDPKGSTIRYEKDLTLAKDGLQSYDFTTGVTWPTGYYDIRLYVKKGKWDRIQIGSTRVKVEEFMPDRLKIDARFSKPKKKGWLKPGELKGVVSLKNLFGTAAQNRRIKGRVTLSPSYPSFDSLRGWNFYDPKRAKQSFDEPLGETKTDDQGMADFDLGLNKYETASYQLRFYAEGFEAEGGRSVRASNSVLISPLDFLVGHKRGGDFNYIKKGAEVPVRFIAVNSDLEIVRAADLKMKLIQYKRVSTLVKQPNGTYKYESVKKDYEKSVEDFKISKEGSKFNLDTTEPGDFAIVVVNKDGLEMNKVQYSVAGSANLSFELEKNAELQVKLNKTDFNPGDEIEISIRAPYVGAGLITIERDQVYAYKWFKTSTKSSVHKISVPEDLEGNGYVNVTFVRSLASEEIFMSPLSVGVAPFSINKSSRINKIDLKVPTLVRPGEDLAIKVSTQKKGKAIIFAVDEGILQVANYQTPDPLSHFYKKRALEVGTRQILDLILPEFAKVAQRLSSEGGGMAEEDMAMLAKNLNPFKRLNDNAAAYWSGIVDVSASEKTLKYKVPDHFSGQLRVMAVVVSADSMDAASDKTLVRGHFVISPNVPTFVAPGDKFKISAGISNNAEKSGENAEIEISLDTSNNIEIVGAANTKQTINEGSEKSVSFDVVAKEPLGNANFIFTARFKDKKSRRTVTSSVRPASPFITRLLTGYVNSGKSTSLKTPRRMFKEFRQNEVTVSKLPLSLAKGFMAYLEKYPYGCTEQITSKSFPSLILSEYKDFKVKKGSVGERVKGVTETYAARQRPDGGFGAWPGSSTVNAFHTTYAIHYLTEAKDRGYKIPKSLMDKALKYLKDFSEQEPKDLEMARVQGYAAYLLTRNEQIVTKALASLEKWLEGYKDKNWVQDVLLLYMASSYKMMKAEEKSSDLIAKFDHATPASSDYRYGIYDDSVKQAMHLYLVSKHFPERVGEFDGKRLQILVDTLAKGYNTRSSALAILAFQAYAKKVQAQSIDGIKVFQVLEKNKEELTFEGDLFPQSSFSPVANSVDIANKAENVAYYSLTQSGFNKQDTPVSNNGVEISREFLDDKGNVISKIKIGEEATVRLRMRTIDKEHYYNMAVVDLLPGGFEVVIDSVSHLRSWANYVDAREDRVLLFSGFHPNVKTVEYKIKAINKGEYKVPPIFAESMYDKSIQTKGSIGTITVE